MSTLKKAVIVALVLPLWVTVTGCGGGGGGEESSGSSVPLSGAVVDGPVSGTTITIKDSSGTTVATGTTGSDGKYSISIPSGTTYPLSISSTGGTDQVTGDTASDMDSLVIDSSQTTANVTPITSVMFSAAVNKAGSLRNVTSTIAGVVKTEVLSKFGFGIDAEDSSIDPITTPVQSSNIVSFMRSSEAMAEVVRRSVGTDVATATRAMRVIGEDMADGSMDGKKSGSALSGTMPKNFTAESIVSAVAQQKALVGMEVVNNSLKVTKSDGAQFSSDEVKTRLSQAINKVEPTVSSTTALNKMEAMPVSSKQKSQMSTDTGNAKAIQEKLGADTTTMSSLVTAANNLETGKAGANKIDKATMSGAESQANTVTSGIKAKTYSSTALSDAFKAIAPSTSNSNSSTSTSSSTSASSSTSTSSSTPTSSSSTASTSSSTMKCFRDLAGAWKNSTGSVWSFSGQDLMTMQDITPQGKRIGTVNILSCDNGIFKYTMSRTTVYDTDNSILTDLSVTSESAASKKVDWTKIYEVKYSVPGGNLKIEQNIGMDPLFLPVSNSTPPTNCPAYTDSYGPNDIQVQTQCKAAANYFCAGHVAEAKTTCEIVKAWDTGSKLGDAKAGACPICNSL